MDLPRNKPVNGWPDFTSPQSHGGVLSQEITSPGPRVPDNQNIGLVSRKGMNLPTWKSILLQIKWLLIFLKTEADRKLFFQEQGLLYKILFNYL